MPKKNKNVACTIQYGRYEINIGHVVAIGESSCGFWQERKDLSVVGLWPCAIILQYIPKTLHSLEIMKSC
jgi:hypothetical protein